MLSGGIDRLPNVCYTHSKQTSTRQTFVLIDKRYGHQVIYEALHNLRVHPREVVNMSRTAMTLIAVLSIIVIVLSLYKRHGAAVSSTRSPVVAAARQSAPGDVPCGCEPAPQIMPDTSQGRRRQKTEDAQEKRQEDRLEKQDKQAAQRLHRLVRLGMSRREVRSLMGEPGMTGAPLVESHSAVDADYYAGGAYEVAYSVDDTVVWVDPL